MEVFQASTHRHRQHPCGRTWPDWRNPCLRLCTMMDAKGWRRSMRQTTQTTKKKDERPPTLRCLARVRCRLEWTLMEGLPKSGAQLQGAENGAAYACARGMDGEKKLLHTPPPTALPCCIYYCTTAVDRTAARLSFLPLPLIYTYCYTSITVPSTTSSPPPPTQPPPPPRSPYLILSPSLPQYSSSNT